MTPQKKEVESRIKKAYASHKRCVICRNEFANPYSKQSSQKINNEAIIDCYMATNILIKIGCRSCPSHFNEKTKLFNEDALKMLKSFDNKINLDGIEVEFLLESLRQRAFDQNTFDKFKSPFLPSDDLCLITFVKIVLITVFQKYNSLNCMTLFRLI